MKVGKASLEVTANDAGKTYNGLAYSGGNGVGYSGFVNGENQSVLGGSVAYGGTAQGAVDASSYTITAGGLTSGNYAIAFHDGTLKVGKAALTVTAKNDSKTYNGLAYSGDTQGVAYSGFVNGQTSSVLGGTLSYSGNSQGAVNAGGYTITAGGPAPGTNAIAFHDGTLTVGKAALTVTAKNDSKTYNGLAYSGDTQGVAYSGFVNGQTS